MKKSPKTIAISIGVFLGLVLAAYAITSHFYRSDVNVLISILEPFSGLK